MDEKTINIIVKDNYENALENSYSFSDWTHEQLADDMIAYSEEVGELAHEFGRDCIITSCKKLGVLK